MSAEFYSLDDLQACEPSALNWDGPVQIRIGDDLDSMGFDSVSLMAENYRDLVTFVRTHWGSDEATGGWFSETVERIEGPHGFYPLADTPDPDDVPEFRFVRFQSEGSGQIWDGFVRIGAESWSAGLYPFVSAGTARAMAAELHHSFRTPRDAHEAGVDWFEVDHLRGELEWEFVVYNTPALGSFVRSAYFDRKTDKVGEDGWPKDPDAWGTSNLFDDWTYASRFPDCDEDGRRIGRNWVDAGALGIAWTEVQS